MLDTLTYAFAGQTFTSSIEVVTSAYGPVSFPSLASARAGLGAPSDANYVMFAGTASTTLEEALMTLGSNDILVLPERADPYLIDSADGFRAPGVSWVQGPNNTQLPIVQTYKGRSARGWFAMARANRGIIGMGPGVIIQPSPSAWSSPQQPVPRAASNGQTLSGAQESLIDCDTANPFFGNFELRGRDFGGIAYHGIKSAQGGTFVNVYSKGGWRGFAGVPNGEAGCITLGKGNYAFRNCEFDGRDEGNNLVGSSPIMFNKNTGGVMESVYIHHTRVGMPTFHTSNGVNTWTNVRIENTATVGLNMEAARAGMVLNWTGGSFKLSTGSSYHIVMNSPADSQKVNLRGVEVSGGRDPGALAVSIYSYASEPKPQAAADITRDNGPVKVYFGY